MNPKLAAMLVGVGAVAGGFLLYTPQPSTRTMLELRDAGIAEGQPVVSVCPERLTPQTVRRITRGQPGALRPRQSYATVARVARCFGSDVLDGGPVGNCLRADGTTFGPFTREVREYRYTVLDAGVAWSRYAIIIEGSNTMWPDSLPDGGLVERIVVESKQAEIIVPSLRQNLLGLDAGEDDGGGDAVDDAWQFDLTSCRLERCNTFDAGAGLFAGCGALNRLVMMPAVGALPDGWQGADGGWDESTPVDCLCAGPYGLPDGGPRWRGFNVCPSPYWSGSQCLPVGSLSVVAGDVPQEWL
jgi:hypothetical protein